MKNKLCLLAPGLLAMSLLMGCTTPQQGGGGTQMESTQPSVGQQLMELQKERDSGAITDSEYQAEKNRLLQLNQR